jgi:branched-chain amino acid transport system substrate-binding protein
MHSTRTLGVALLLAGLAPAAIAEEFRIGLLNTTTGSIAVIGEDVQRGWKLGLEHEGWSKDGDRLGGAPTRIFYADDQFKTDVAVREVERMFKSDRVHMVAGVIASNVMMAVSKLIFDAKVVLVGTNAGPSPIAGALCNPLFVSTAFVNDQSAEATGELVTRDGVKTVFLLAPNYQAGKDNLAGFQRTYKGKIVGQSLVKLGDADFQAEFSLIRAAKPEAVSVFAPGAMAVSFMKQWEATGLGQSIRLYPLYMIDNTTLPAMGASAVGSTYTGHWNPDFDHPRNKAFVKAFVAKHNSRPAMFAAQSYDAARGIAAALRTLGGKIDDVPAIARTMRKNVLASVRGDLKYNTNGFLLQPYWKIEVVAGPDGKPLERGGDKVMERPDSYWEKCPIANRL